RHVLASLSPSLPAARPPRRGSGAAALERKFHHQWHPLHRLYARLLFLGCRRAHHAYCRRLARLLFDGGILQFSPPPHLSPVVPVIAIGCFRIAIGLADTNATRR